MDFQLHASNKELQEKFFSLKNLDDIARLLEIDRNTLIYNLYWSSNKSRYQSFTIPKKSGGFREILAPNPSLKIIQRKLLQVLKTIYSPRPQVHGFVDGKSILSNAQAHTGKRNVLNIDLLDFFPSINFGRVRGMFMEFPYYRNPKVATVLAQICCFDNQLPQGSPTSPIISNMICAKMDSELRLLAQKNRCFFTRYSDDISFSTTVRRFPGNLATILPSGDVQIGEDLLEVVKNNGFEINPLKVRLQTEYRHQEVTGLTVNLFPNVRRRFIRQIRSMIHDWEKNGLERAQDRHREHFSKSRAPFKLHPPFERIVKGKIDYLGMVKGKDDPNYLRFLYKYARLNPAFELTFREYPSSTNGLEAMVITGGKTDWMHMKSAFLGFKKLGIFSELNLLFQEKYDPVGDDKLWNKSLAFADSPQPYPMPQIFVFDRDNKNALSKVHLSDKQFHSFGNNVFSVSLPIPSHRKDTPEICIELLYLDSDIKRMDTNGRRLFLSNEFHHETGWHIQENIIYPYPRSLDASKLKIIDDNVFDRNGRELALSKARFAQYIFEQKPGFDDFDISGFELLFNLFIEILLNENSV